MAERIESLASHPARPSQSLADHLEGVVENVRRLLPANARTAYGDDWLTVGEAIAWTHDAGKLTAYFRAYLDANDRSVAPRPEYTYHGFASALLVGHVLYSLDVSDAARTAGFYAVAKHHSVVPTLSSEHDDYTGSAERVATRFEVAREQFQSIDRHASDAIDDLLDTASDGALGWDDVYIDSPKTYRCLLCDPDCLDTRFYETVLRAWSTLVCADKLDAANIGVPESVTRPSRSVLMEYMRDLPTGDTPLDRELNALRARANEQSTDRILEYHRDGERFFRLTLPTGFGKTLTGLRSALELAEERDSRVIYALPYTSILDQVDEVCREALDAESEDQAYTIHHHLADTRTNVEELTTGDHVSDGSEVMFAETWQSGLVLTTFTQLFESLAGPGNTQSMKLPALQDSVLVIDEPQSISIGWWELVSRLTRFLNREYDATLVLMTATQPRLLERVPDLPVPKPLTDETDACVDFLDAHPRVKFHLHRSLADYLDDTDTGTEPLSSERVARELLETTSPPANTLAIVNTIASAATVTEDLYEEAGQMGPRIRLADELCQFYRQTQQQDTDTSTLASAYLKFLDDRAEVTVDTTLIVTLTTRIRPRDRSLLLTALRRILNDETSTPFDDSRTITVSTQLIEAGVDLSFDRLYRDFAPLPALVQAAGRCNREYDGPVGRVTIWRLANPLPEASPPSKLIYGDRSLLRPTRHAIDSLRDDHGDVLPESAMISTGVDEYYRALHEQRRTADREDTLVRAFDAGDGDRLRRASLVDPQYETRDVVVLVTETDAEQFARYQRLRDSEQWQSAKDAFDDLKPLIVTVPVRDEFAEHATEDVLYVLKSSESSDRYEVETGRGVQMDAVSLDTER